MAESGTFGSLNPLFISRTSSRQLPSSPGGIIWHIGIPSAFSMNQIVSPNGLPLAATGSRTCGLLIWVLLMIFLPPWATRPFRIVDPKHSAKHSMLPLSFPTSPRASLRPHDSRKGTAILRIEGNSRRWGRIYLGMATPTCARTRRTRRIANLAERQAVAHPALIQHC